MKERILAGRILVEPVEVDEKTAGGIIVPDLVKKAPTTGKVVVRGDDLIDVKMELREGDDVVFPEGVGQKVEIHEKTYLLMRQEEVLYYTRD